MNITRRALLATAAATFAAGYGFAALAQDAWPSRIVRLVSPYGAGGATTSRCVSWPNNSGAG